MSYIKSYLRVANITTIRQNSAIVPSSLDIVAHFKDCSTRDFKILRASQLEN